MEILNGINVVRSGMTRHVDREIFVDISKDSGAYIVLTAGWDPGTGLDVYKEKSFLFGVEPQNFHSSISYRGS